MRVVAEPSCPDPNRWRQEGGSCYAFNHQEASFAESRRQCLSLSTHEFRVTLPVIKSAEEDAALLSECGEGGGLRCDCRVGTNRFTDTFVWHTSYAEMSLTSDGTRRIDASGLRPPLDVRLQPVAPHCAHLTAVTCRRRQGW